MSHTFCTGGLDADGGSVVAGRLTLLEAGSLDGEEEDWWWWWVRGEVSMSDVGVHMQ
jgi:hypothetical protein